MLFEPRENILPYEYPELLKFKDSIQHSYWIVSEFNFTSDIQDFHTNINESERSIIKRCMLAISQIEVNVKTFWGKLYDRMPICEIGDVGGTFMDSEIRHKDAYVKLLTVLGLQEEFKDLPQVPAIANRIKYLKKYSDGTRSREDRIFTKSLILFSLFIEHVSLFSQFYTIMSFNKERNLFKGISNVVEATSKEEDVHGNFGVKLVQILREEYPEWFDEDMENMIKSAAQKAYIAELGIIDWIFENGETEFINKEILSEFIKNRFNKSLTSLGYTPIFEVDEKIIEKTEWFDIELTTTKEGDIFYKRGTDYNKKSKSITEDDLF